MITTTESRDRKGGVMRLKRILAAAAATAVLVGAPAGAFAGAKKTAAKTTCTSHYNPQDTLVGCGGGKKRK
jgi:hypothetical protein